MSYARPSSRRALGAWSLSDPRTQYEILQEDYGGDVDAFMRDSPSAEVAALYSDPALTPAGVTMTSDGGLVDAQGNDVAIASDGSLVSSSGQTIAPASSTLATQVQAINDAAALLDDPNPQFTGPESYLVNGVTYTSLADAQAAAATGDVPPAVTDGMAYDALDAVQAAGGDVTQPTAIVDKTSGATVAVVQQLPDGRVSLKPGGANIDLASIVNKVTGFLDGVAGTLKDAGTEVQKVAHAVQGGATGAQAGYNAPTSWTPVIVGGVVLGGALLLSRGRR